MKAEYPLVGIVVLNFNGKSCLLQCLESLSLLHYQNFFVIVVDNGSQDDSLSLARATFPSYTYIENQKNLGFAGGMNIGMKKAFSQGAKFVWLFNNDATTHPLALQYLIHAALAKPNCGLLSPSVYASESRTLWFGGGRINALRMRGEHISLPRTAWRQEIVPCEFVTGCAMLVKRDVFEMIGPLDEQFFLYYEDVDFSMRAREGGFSVGVVPRARVFHREQSEANSQKQYFLVLSGLRFFKKHTKKWQWPYFLGYVTVRKLKNRLDRYLTRRNAQAVFQAYKDFPYDIKSLF